MDQFEGLLQLPELQDLMATDHKSTPCFDSLHNMESIMWEERENYSDQETEQHEDQYMEGGALLFTNNCSRSSTCTTLAEALNAADSNYYSPAQRSSSCTSSENTTSCSSWELLPLQHRHRQNTSSCTTNTTLKARKGPHFSMSKKRSPLHNPQIINPAATAQYRKPIIIHTYSPKVIHTSPAKFMWLVQSLTGSPETRLRCLKSTPPEASMGAPDYNKQNCGGSAPATASKFHVFTPTPIYPSVQLPNPYITSRNSCSSFRNPASVVPVVYTPSALVNPNCLSNLPAANAPANQGSNSVDQGRMMKGQAQEQANSSPSPCCSAKEVSPRGPLSATEFDQEGQPTILPSLCAKASIYTPPAPDFENWDWSMDLQVTSAMADTSVHSSSTINTSASSCLLHSDPDAGYVSSSNPGLSPDVSTEATNPSPPIPNLSVGSNDLSILNAQLNWANACREIAMWDITSDHPIDTFL